MKTWSVSKAGEAFPIGAKVKFFLSLSNKEDFREGVVSSKPRIFLGEVVVSLYGHAGAFCVNHLEISE